MDIQTGELRENGGRIKLQEQPLQIHLESWPPDGAHVLMSLAERPEGTLVIWNLSIVEGAPRKIVEDGWGASVSPDEF